ncbi:uncharacterized protein LOC106076176 isoform X3 [Biomphalaria glabrata]|nr:uncharacterized protein LOC106076176 isoform X3 [Biomphalaria glabrata]XP_055899099.1 uncharacterized protein LOC106076176 isoform X3 [Biomphalaria glabrata]
MHWIPSLILLYFSFSCIHCQLKDFEGPPYQIPPCSNAEILVKCRNILDTTLRTSSINNTLDLCRTRWEFVNCTQEALCFCTYPRDTLYLSQALKDISKIAFGIKKDNCEQYNSNYAVTNEVKCSGQSLSERVSVNTSAAPIIQSLMTKCPAYKLIFTTRDDESTLALNSFNYTKFCTTFSSFLNAFEKSTCECQLQDDVNIYQVNEFEKRDYLFQCDQISGFVPPLPEIACDGLCSLKQPASKCEEELRLNLITAAGDQEQMCRHMSTYGKCFEDIVCQCGFYQRKEYYSAVAIAKFTFNIKQNCSIFQGLTFSSSQIGFPCPDDQQITADKKTLILNTSQEIDQSIRNEIVQCPAIKSCLLQFDQDGSIAFNKKNLPDICIVMSSQIQCLLNVTCSCGLVLFKLSETMALRYHEFSSLCNNVIPPVPDFVCDNFRQCNSSNPLQQCDAALNKTTSLGELPHGRTCLNILDRDVCMKEISCRCAMVENGSSSTAYTVYKILTDNILQYNVLGCSTVTGIPTDPIGFVCPGTKTDISQPKLVLNWTQSAEKRQFANDCPTVKMCYDQSDSVEAESLYTLDAKRLCRNGLNYLKCVVKSFCRCGLFDSRSVDIQKEITLHNSKCSKYAPYGMPLTCNETELCQQAQFNDICFTQLANGNNSLASKCYDWVNYIKCAQDMACTCQLIPAPTAKRTDLVFINLAKINYLLFAANNCTDALSQVFLTIPEVIYNQNFQCFNPVTAELRLLPLPDISISKASEIIQIANICPDLRICARKYDMDKLESFYKLEFLSYCISTSNFIQCIYIELCKCNISSSTEAKSLETLIRSYFVECQSVVDPGSVECERVGEGAGFLGPTTPYDKQMPSTLLPTFETKGPSKSQTDRNSQNGTVNSFSPSIAMIVLTTSILWCQLSRLH